MRHLLTFLSIAWVCFSIQAQPKSYAQSGALSQPRIFGEGIVSTGDYESHPAFSPGGDTLYFVKSGPDISKWTK